MASALRMVSRRLSMAETNRDRAEPESTDRSELEPERVRSSNDEDQAGDHDARDRTRERGYEDSSRSSSDPQSEDVDPDSADADIDRDDTVEDI